MNLPIRAMAVEPDGCDLFNALHDEPIVCKVAQTRDERKSAFRLLHEGYVANDLMTPNEFGMRVTPWQVFPSTQIYVAIQRREVLYTMSLAPDEWAGLPLEELYADEIASLRDRGLRLAEVTCLTSSKKYSHQEMFEVFADLVALMFQQARRLKIDGLVIAVHPRHANFYGSKLGFRQIGPERIYSLVEKKPAVLCYHNFCALDSTRYPLYDRIYAPEFPPSQLVPVEIPNEDREYFQPVIDATVGGKYAAVS